MDKIEIINLALARIGVAAIERIDEPSEAARQAKAFYDHARRTVLRKYPWTFATRSSELALLPEKSTAYKYAYRYPADALCLRRLYKIGSRKPWDRKYFKSASDKEGRTILTNMKFAEVEYTADITDTTLFDDGFIEALSWKLAAEIAFALTGKIELANNAVQAYNAYFADAAGEDAAEDREPEEDVNTFAMARFVGW